MVRILISIVFLCNVLPMIITSGKAERKGSAIVMASDSYLEITGKTNVSKFQCEFDMATLSDSISVNYTETQDKIKFEKASLNLPNIQFDCGGKAINKDFRKLLNTNEFPAIQLRLKEIDKNPHDNGCVMAKVEIVISGIANTYKVPVFKDEADFLIAKSDMELNIGDFNLEPPSKVMGLVKVSPVIKIHFTLKILAS